MLSKWAGQTKKKGPLSIKAFLNGKSLANTRLQGFLNLILSKFFTFMHLPSEENDVKTTDIGARKTFGCHVAV
jgi:hypothetical protein